MEPQSKFHDDCFCNLRISVFSGLPLLTNYNFTPRWHGFYKVLASCCGNGRIFPIIPLYFFILYLPTTFFKLLHKLSTGFRSVDSKGQSNKLISSA